MCKSDEFLKMGGQKVNAQQHSINNKERLAGKKTYEKTINNSVT